MKSLKKIFNEVEKNTKHKLIFLKPRFKFGWLEYPAKCKFCRNEIYLSTEQNAIYYKISEEQYLIYYLSKNKLKKSFLNDQKEKYLCPRLINLI